MGKSILDPQLTGYWAPIPCFSVSSGRTALYIVDKPLHRHFLLASLALQTLEKRVGENTVPELLDFRACCWSVEAEMM